MTDYYKVLGVDKNATPSEVKSAFRKLALKFHPDRHADSSEHYRNAASERFKDLLEAYEVLSDEKKRTQYNRRGRAGYNPQGPGKGGSYGGHEAYRGNPGDAGRGTYRQGPFYGSVHPGSRWRSGSRMQWNFALGFTRMNYLFHGLLITLVVIGFTTADKAADALWKIQNTGKSFEETIDAVERRKQGQMSEEGKRSSTASR